MSYLDILRRGSGAHKVQVRGLNTIMIVPVGKSEKDMLAFQQVVLDAIAYSFEGYEIIPHRIPGKTYDYAVISWEDMPYLD